MVGRLAPAEVFTFWWGPCSRLGFVLMVAWGSVISGAGRAGSSACGSCSLCRFRVRVMVSGVLPPVFGCGGGAGGLGRFCVRAVGSAVRPPLFGCGGGDGGLALMFRAARRRGWRGSCGG